MNVISGLCDCLIEFLKVMSGKEEGAAEFRIGKVIEDCNLALADLWVNRLMEELRGKPPDGKPQEPKT